MKPRQQITPAREQLRDAPDHAAEVEYVAAVVLRWVGER
jgi:hypothetical protein